MQRLYEENAYRQHVGSWWEETAQPIKWPTLQQDLRAHTTIIGGGYTGLNCALELTERFGVDGIVVLEANQPGWGASGRNGGFCCMGGSKLDFKGHVRRFGEAQTLDYYNTQIAAVETVQDNLKRYEIDADLHSSGETQLAHRWQEIDALQVEQALLKDRLGLNADFADRSKLTGLGLQSPEFHAALTNPIGFALNPMKYVAGLTRVVDQVGVATYGNSPALEIEAPNHGWTIKTPKASVTSKNLVIATNGYSSETLPPWIGGRLLPVLTNILVTRPITEKELRAQGWTSHQMCYDTRNSLHYFHLLPLVKGEVGPRMLFGMRGGTSAGRTAQQAMQKRIRADFDRFFPAWHDVRSEYFWSGLACLTRDLTSYTGPVPGLANAWASLAYHGNGVAMASHSGRLLARIIKGELTADDLPPAMRQPPRKFPFPALRRSYLAAAYKWYEWRDG